MKPYSFIVANIAIITFPLVAIIAGNIFIIAQIYSGPYCYSSIQTAPGFKKLRERAKKFVVITMRF